MDDIDAPEWNTEALGEEKEWRAGLLIRKLREQIYSRGLLHFGQGKWYPAESLPRWSFTCYWRADVMPLWREAQWIANPETGYGNEQARAFAEALARG